MLRRALSVVALGALAAVAAFAPVSASATILTDLTASPETIAVGETSTLTATDLGGIDSVFFDVDADPGGSLSAGGATGTSIEVGVSGGSATAEFSASTAGLYEISVRDGATVLAVASVEVTAPIETAPGGATLTVAPETIRVGETAEVTAGGLGDLGEATFALDSTPGGSLAIDDQTAARVVAPVSDGAAAAQFTATEPGVFTITVGDGESPLARATVTVEEGPATASPTTTPDDTVGEGADADAAGFPWGIVIAVVAVLVVIAAVVAVFVTRRKRSV